MPVYRHSLMGKHFITEHIDAMFSHGLCPKCFNEEMEMIDGYED